MRVFALFLMLFYLENIECSKRETESLFSENEAESVFSKFRFIKIKDRATQLWYDFSEFMKNTVNSTQHSIAGYRKGYLPSDFSEKIENFQTTGKYLIQELDKFITTLKQLPIDQTLTKSENYSSINDTVKMILSKIPSNIENYNTAHKMINDIQPHMIFLKNSLQNDQFMKQYLSNFEIAFDEICELVKTIEHNVFKNNAEKNFIDESLKKDTAEL
ncbi:MAG: hypothetical protein E7015_03420 [Alphaproteobacteria bacterium]|nr:hypothetical protein [Alphaproteobacteria bacterium]